MTLTRFTRDPAVPMTDIPNHVRTSQVNVHITTEDARDPNAFMAHLERALQQFVVPACGVVDTALVRGGRLYTELSCEVERHSLQKSDLQLYWKHLNAGDILSFSVRGETRPQRHIHE